ncbi:aquaporin-like protein [Schizophyllum commune Tattone D]|nr:aquaporin-like protein [Schizophyllum commune Tattone D]
MQNGSSTGTSGATAGSDAERLFAFYYISAAFGISLTATATIFYRFTGSIFNPNVALALFLVGAIKPLRFILVALAEMVGAIVAAAILDGLTPGPLAAGVTLGSGTNRTQGLFIEMFCTAALVLNILMLAAEKHRFTPFAPLGFGFTLFSVMLFSVQFTGGAINTARAFGPACIEGFHNYHWIYWLGPTLGSLLATAVYVGLKSVHYWRITPGQDSMDPRDAPMQQVV